MSPDEFSAFQVGYYLFVDMEATCDRSDFPRSERETIELGAVLVDGTDLSVANEFQSFIRPQRHPRLTDYCCKLTTITQAEVDSAPFFPEAMAAFSRDFVQGRDVLFCAWGPYDRRQLKRDCLSHGLVYPFLRHVDLAKIFAQRVGSRRRMGMERALNRVGLQLEGRAHRGIDDARNLVKLMPWCLGQKDIPDVKDREGRSG